MPQPARARLSALLRGPVGVRQGPVSRPGDLTGRRAGQLHPDTGATFARPHTRPRLTQLEVGETVAGSGMPVTLTWAFDGARTVTVDGVTGYPSHGQTTITLERTRHVEVVGHNEIGSTTARSQVVTVIPVPRIDTLTLPQMPTVRLHADVRATVAAGETVRVRLNQAMDGQDRFRPVLAQKLQPIGVPTHFVRWLAAVPRVSFFRSSS